MNKRTAAEVLLLLLLLGAVAVAYAGAAKLSWTYDDAFLLRLASAWETGDYFISRAFWRALPSQMFPPLLHVWYEAGAYVSDLEDARGFYVLTIILLLAALAVSYAALRVWLGSAESLTAVAMIGLGPPTVAVVTQLMATHYLVALVLAAGAVALYGMGWRWASAFFYMGAMLAKEVAVPLVVLLMLLPTGPGRTKSPASSWLHVGRTFSPAVGRALYAVFPHLLMLVVYFVWRKAMIGVFLGGYGWAVTRENLGALLRSLPRQVAQGMTPPQVWLAVLVGVVLLIPIAWRMRSRAFAVAAIIALGAAIAPVLPVSREMQPRYVFAAWVTLAVLFAIAARGKAWLLIAGALVVAVAHRAEWRDALPLSERMSAETRFILRAPADATLREPKTPPAAMGELMWMRSQLGAPAGLQWFYDDMYLCAGRHAGRRVFGYVESCRCIRQVTADVASCSSVRTDVPLEASFRYDNETLRWTFGPYERGAWKVILADGAQVFTVPREDAYRMGSLQGITLRVRYDSPEGWRTYSDDIALDFVNRPRYLWKR